MDDLAQTLVEIFMDPTHPLNQLKRPATRVCRCCGDAYRSRVAMLADDGLCADCIETPSYIRLGITPAEALLRAILGE